MKKLLIGLAIAFLFCGCASVNYEKADGTKVTYSRLFTTADSLEVTVGDASAKVNGQKIDATTLNALIQVLGAAK